MARNKITFEREFDDVGRATYRFTGSLRQPTPNEVEEFLEDNWRRLEIDDDFMVFAIQAKREDCGYQGGFGEPQRNKTLECWGYDGGRNDGSCPICGKERDLSKSRCPVCLKPWDE